MAILTEICQYLRNWFPKKAWIDDFVISNVNITGTPGSDLELVDGAYYRIKGSLFNDGLFKFPTELKDETFSGAVWLCAIPEAVVQLAQEIENWQTTYGKQAASPFQSESFTNYSYSKGSGGSSGDTSWQTVFASRLAPWRKI